MESESEYYLHQLARAAACATAARETPTRRMEREMHENLYASAVAEAGFVNGVHDHLLAAKQRVGQLGSTAASVRERLFGPFPVPQGPPRNAATDGPPGSAAAIEILFGELFMELERLAEHIHVLESRL